MRNLPIKSNYKGLETHWRNIYKNQTILNKYNNHHYHHDQQIWGLGFFYLNKGLRCWQWVIYTGKIFIFHIVKRECFASGMWNSWNPDFLKKMRLIRALLHMLPRYFNFHDDFAETTIFKLLFFFLEDFCIRISLHGFVAFLNLQEWPIRKTHAYTSHSVAAPNLNLLVSAVYLDGCLFKKGRVHISSYYVGCQIELLGFSLWMIQCDRYYYTFSVSQSLNISAAAWIRIP